MDLNKLFRTQWDRTSAVILSIVGLVFLLVGYIGVSGTPYLAGQAPYILSGGVGGIFFLGYGATLWISADLRDEWKKLDRIEDALKNGTLRWTEDEPEDTTHYEEPHYSAPVYDGPDYLDDTSELQAVPATRRAPARATSTARRTATTANGRAKTTGAVRGSQA